VFVAGAGRLVSSLRSRRRRLGSTLASRAVH
jgi:hypothetical protein